MLQLKGLGAEADRGGTRVFAEHGAAFRQHAGNADVVRLELAREKNIMVSLRTVERAVAPLRRELVAAARATVRFETRLKCRPWSRPASSASLASLICS
jgi:hypothetical protein